MPSNPNLIIEENLRDLLKKGIAQQSSAGRTFGFEYELISRKPLSAKQFKDLQTYIEDQGHPRSERGYELPSGLFFVFEPGGQIEFGSPPLIGRDSQTFDALMDQVRKIRDGIESALGIEYVPTGFLPNRARTPLLLKTPRYIAMQQHLSQKGRRGLEMMKGTASIHLHVSINTLEEIPLLFDRVSAVAQMEPFGMSPVRRDIWNNTDSSRSGVAPLKENIKDTDSWIAAYVKAVLDADNLETGKPFSQSPEISFEGFLNHMSTMFWDVRLNLKGPTIEMRTLDTLPPAGFKRKWEIFIQHFST